MSYIYVDEIFFSSIVLTPLVLDLLLSLFPVLSSQHLLVQSLQ